MANVEQANDLVDRPTTTSPLSPTPVTRLYVGAYGIEEQPPRIGQTWPRPR